MSNGKNRTHALMSAIMMASAFFIAKLYEYFPNQQMEKIPRFEAMIGLVFSVVSYKRVNSYGDRN
jgi:hypothetical protein